MPERNPNSPSNPQQPTQKSQFRDMVDAIRYGTTFLTDPFPAPDHPFDTGKLKNGKKVAISPAIGLALVAHAITFIPRAAFHHSLFPQSDKVSDFGASTWEPTIFTRYAKTLIDNIVKQVSPDTFTYESMTHAEAAIGALWYGTLWVTSEIAAIHRYHPLFYTTADPLDIPAEAAGVSVAYATGREYVRRIPGGRFGDIERSVEGVLQKDATENTPRTEAMAQVLLQSLQAGDEQEVAGMAFLQEYKRVYTLIRNDVLKRTKDIRGLIKKDKEQISLYDALVRNYTHTFARKWFLKKLQEAGLEGTSMWEYNVQRSITGVERTRRAAENYRDRASGLEVEE